MTDIKPPSITIKMDGKEFPLYEDEILSDPELNSIFRLHEAIVVDANNTNIRMETLKYALYGVRGKLQDTALAYIKQKYFPELSAEEVTDEE